MFGSAFHASVAQSAAAAAQRMRASSSFRSGEDARAFPDLIDAKIASDESLEVIDPDDSDDVYELADAYGSDAAARLSKILRHLERVGFAKARANEWSAFDRILSGVAWVLQQIVTREDATVGRVQWDALFQSHTKMKPRLGFTQEVVKRIEALPYACPVQIQPHQLLLQDFGDIGAVHRLVTWLVDQQQSATPHLDAIRKHRKYQGVLDREDKLSEPKPLKKDVLYLQNAFKPRRKWQYMASEDWKNEPEDALIQRCLLEYGERVCVAVLDDGKAPSAATESFGSAVGGVDGKPPNLMAQLASQAAAAATAGATLTKSRPGSGGRNGRRRASSKRFVDPQAADFEIQYQKAMKQAIAEQQKLLNKQKEREIQLLQQVVLVSEGDESELLGSVATEVAAGSVATYKARSSVQLENERVALQEHEAQVQQLIEAKRVLEVQTQEAQDQATAVSQTIASIEQEIAQLDVKEAQDRSAQPLLATLKNLVIQNETLKRQKNEFRVKCRAELEKLHTRIAQLKLQAEEDLVNQDEETLRLNEIEQMHAQMAAKHKEMKVALARQTREVQLKMRQIDEVPTRIELIQYEKRFLELYEEVALTLDETRKYFCTYNTLQTTQEFLEREISLINSISENFDVAMSSKAATQAFFTQLEGIIQNVQGTVTKQQTQRGDHQKNVETLDSKYQLLLEKERTYVNAIREFQKECEKNEKLSARLAQQQGPQVDQQPLFIHPPVCLDNNERAKMSTKQKNSLTFEASLGACLNFAGQVLSAALPPSQVCTKEVLSPIVVEAHRFGQQVGKSCGSSLADKAVSVDPRKLLKKLQNYQSEPEWDRAGVQIDRLAFEDLTWDSQGDVAQTLEMELLELESRAAEANLSVCVLLTLRAIANDFKAIVVPESAILWLPLENHQDSNNGKKQYLLYACPGRIKVVKSVVELLKKLREEVKLMSDNDAVYNVWTLSRAATSQVKKKPAAAATTVSNQRREVERTHVVTPRNDEAAEKACFAMEMVKHKLEEAKEMDGGSSLPLEEATRSHRAMSVRPVQNEARVLTNSIFSFTKEATVRAQVESGATAEDVVSVESNSKNTLDEDNVTSTAAELTVLSQQQAVTPLKQGNEKQSPRQRRSVPSRRQLASASYSNGDPASAMTTSKQEKRIERSELLWQSLDSDLKKPVLPPKRTHQTIDPAGEAETENITIDEAQRVTPSAFSSSHKESAPTKGPVVGGEYSRHQTPQAVSEKNMSQQWHSSEQLDESLFPGSIDSGVVNQVIESEVVMEEKANIGDDDQNLRAASRKPAPARKNYKAKLGNRVWWELQCAAERLLQEQCAGESAKPCGDTKHIARRKDPLLEHKAVKGIASRSPSRDTKLKPQPSESQRDDVHSKMNASSSGAVSQLSHSKPAASILIEDELAYVPKPVEALVQTLTLEDEPAKNVSAGESTTKDSLHERAPEQLLALTAGFDDEKPPIISARKATSSSFSNQSTHNEGQSPLFTKTALFKQKNQDSVSNYRANKHQASPEKDIKTARPDGLSREVVNASKSDIPPKLAHLKSSKKPATGPGAFDYYAEDQAETRVATRALEPRKSPEANPAWVSESHDVSHSCAAEDDDDDSVQNQWASTRTSYAVERERHDQEAQMQSRFEPPATTSTKWQAKTKMPFSVQGRVPIRSSQHVQPKHINPQFDDVDSSSDEDNVTMDQFRPTPRKASEPTHRSSTTRANSRHDDGEDDYDSDSKAVEAKPRAIDRRPPHVATFITFEQDAKASSKKSTNSTAQKQPIHSREEKLAELRQKKLSQLHKAREEQQQQQQQKKTKSLLLQKTKSTLAAQTGVYDENFAPTSTPGKATTSGLGTTTHLRAAKKPSNKKLIQNALEYTLLAGFSMEKERNAALQALAQSTCDNFIVLLKSTKDLKFRALYEHHTDRHEVVRLFASTPNAPLMLTSDTIGQFFKYNSGKKEFVAIDSRAFTMKTDACALKDEIVFKKKATLGKLL